VGWRVDPQRAVTFLENTQSLERCQDLLEPYVRDAKTKVVGQYDFRNFASIIPDDLKHAQMEEEIKRLINDGARTPGEGTPVARGVRQQLGIEVALVKLKRVELPQEVASKVFERMKNERKIEADGYRAEGRAISKDIRSRAEAAYKAILSMAEGDAEAIKGKGEAEAAEFFKELHKHPDLALFLLQVRALPKVAEKLTIILDPTVPPFNLLLGVPDVKVQPQAK
jgi:membrane protease subunit HflC